MQSSKEGQRWLFQASSGLHWFSPGANQDCRYILKNVGHANSVTPSSWESLPSADHHMNALAVLVVSWWMMVKLVTDCVYTNEPLQLALMSLYLSLSWDFTLCIFLLIRSVLPEKHIYGFIKACAVIYCLETYVQGADPSILMYDNSILFSRSISSLFRIPKQR